MRQTIKSKTLGALRHALTSQHLRNQVSEPHVDRMLRLIDPGDPNVLTVGFARRFATYKRATLLFNDLDWLREIIGDGQRPVVFVFAGKAHPADIPGQELLRDVHRVSCMPEFVGRVLLVEGYDLALARLLLAGVDVWLNNPIYPLEASGTSGMKSAINGGLNLSVADGWWGEGYAGDNGWAIRPSPHEEDPERRDAEDARTLYELLQDEVLPLYYARDGHGYSPGWVRRCKRSMATVLPGFNMHRVVNEYTERLYAPASRGGRALTAAGLKAAKALGAWKARVRTAWPGVAVTGVTPAPARAAMGDEVRIETTVRMEGLTPEDVCVELVLERREDDQVGVSMPGENPVGRAEGNGIARRHCLPLSPGERPEADGSWRFGLDLQPDLCGRLCYRVRIYPRHELLAHPFEMGLMRWA